MISYVRPFHAADERQFSEPWAAAGHTSEAIVFDAADCLDADTWDLVKGNLAAIRRRYPTAGLNFHFPVNDANYVDTKDVRDRLWETLDYLGKIGATGLVLHANQTRTAAAWNVHLIAQTRERFHAFARTLSERVVGLPFWVGLENMPATGNDVWEYDPILVYPEDFDFLRDLNLKVVIDLCHLSYTYHISRCENTFRTELLRGYPHIKNTSMESLWQLGEDVVHLHFSAFRWMTLGERLCEEGLLPWNSTLGDDYYRELFARIVRKWPSVKTVSFEVREENYADRRAFPEIVDWANEVLTEVRLEEGG